MARSILLTLAWMFVVTGIVRAQTTILDFETAATSTTFQYFGSALDGQLTASIANPNPSGINTSAKVMEFKKPAGAQVWAGAFSNPNPTTPVNVINGGKVCIKFHTDHPGNLTLKLEGSPDGGPNWVLTQPVTTLNQWVELSFDISLPSIEAPNQPANGHLYNTITLFADFGVSPTSDLTFYIDDVIVKPAINCVTVLDFENPATTTTFQYFGSSLDGQPTSTIANPNATGLNTSATVLQFKKPAGAQVWAGAFSNPNPATPVNVTNGGQVCILFHTDHPGNLTLKLEGSPNGGPNWVFTQPVTTLNEWVELCFDVNLPSIESPNQPAKGFIYNTITLFTDFGVSPTTDQTYYLDDIEVCSSGGPQVASVVLKADMTQYAGAFNKVYVSGGFNGWSGDANPMLDFDGDGIWEVTLNLPVGLHEYKFNLDNYAVVEMFPVTSACTQTTYDGPNVFTNRKLVLSGNTTLAPVCFNSCYGCGQSVQITYNLGMGAVTPNPEGVYLAGGAEFGPPGGRFRMFDDNGDGVYALTIERERGYGGFYTFANGPCPDFSCKENLTGQSCAQPQNFDDRLLNPVQQDTVINTCFALCATNVDCTNSTRNLEFDREWLRLQPTLTSDLVQIALSGRPEPATIRVMSGNGQVVYEGRLQDSVLQLHTADWPSGVYTVLAFAGNRFSSARFVKQ